MAPQRVMNASTTSQFCPGERVARRRTEPAFRLMFAHPRELGSRDRSFDVEFMAGECCRLCSLVATVKAAPPAPAGSDRSRGFGGCCCRVFGEHSSSLTVVGAIAEIRPSHMRRYRHEARIRKPELQSCGRGTPAWSHDKALKLLRNSHQLSILLRSGAIWVISERVGTMMPLPTRGFGCSRRIRRDSSLPTGHRGKRRFEPCFQDPLLIERYRRHS